MSYAVCHRDATDTLHVADVASLDAAVEAVERLRNEDGTSDVRVFREVPIEVRTYYKVVIADEDAAAAVTPVTPVAVAPETTAPVAVVAESATDPVVVETATPESRAPSTARPVDTLPGAFPLASPTPPPPVEVHDVDHDTAADASRRHSLFSRGG
ncbi:hypothetical protein [Nitriliruptor alkaliphilus]|uniref:hypothetical protein n=1 Tax=Nitriliruptor alkaliphilus TaxID=427918 RepID=UPI000695DA81|nr:hypothetical protein [Nitriliruptor alkaliphilus]